MWGQELVQGCYKKGHGLVWQLQLQSSKERPENSEITLIGMSPSTAAAFLFILRIILDTFLQLTLGGEKLVAFECWGKSSFSKGLY